MVTGGARGCGLAFAQGLAQAGANVAIFDVIDPVPAFFEIEKLYDVKTGHYKSVAARFHSENPHIASSECCQSLDINVRRVDVSKYESLTEGFEAFKADFDGVIHTIYFIYFVVLRQLL